MADAEVWSADMGAVGAVMHGHMKADDRGGGQMSGCGSHVEWVTDMGEGLPGHGDGEIQMCLV